MRKRYRYRPIDPMANENGFVEVAGDVDYSEFHHIIRDEMAPTRHMANGQIYTSKRKFREATRCAGCVEIGNEVETVTKQRKPIELSREERRGHIHRAIKGY